MTDCMTTTAFGSLDHTVTVSLTLSKQRQWNIPNSDLMKWRGGKIKIMKKIIKY